MGIINQLTTGGYHLAVTMVKSMGFTQIGSIDSMGMFHIRLGSETMVHPPVSSYCSYSYGSYGPFINFGMAAMVMFHSCHSYDRTR